MTGDNGDIVTLSSGPSGLQVCPAAGGSITRYWWEHAGKIFEWLRPAAAADIAGRNPLGMACFPLVPFSGRIREGRFTFRKRTVGLPLNFPPERHATYGQGWRTPGRLRSRFSSWLPPLIVGISSPGVGPWDWLRAHESIS